MAWAFSTDAVLAAIRTAIGASVTVNAIVFTWANIVEGDPQRWLADADTDYPLIILQPGDTDPTDGAKHIRMALPVGITVVIKASSSGASGVAPAAYKTARLVGEAVMGKLMDAGPHLGTAWLRRVLGPCGVDYATTERVADHGLLCYQGNMTFDWGEPEIAP